MSEVRKIIEQDGVKYCKEGGQWYQMFPIKEDEVLENKKPTKINLLPEIQLDIFKFLDFTQLLAVQQTNAYFKNFIYEHGKVLAMKEFGDLEMLHINEETINAYKHYRPYPKLYDFELEEHRLCDFGMCEQKYKFFKPEPRLYEFELGEELEKKWKDGIKNSIPMFLTSVNPNVNTVICELERDYKTEKDLYYFQLSKYPKNIEEMKIARYFFQLLFNCSFKIFKIHHVIINQQMIELLFYNEIKANVPLQIHSQGTCLLLHERSSIEFVWNHLVSNQFRAVFNENFYMEQNMDILFKILTNGGDKFSEVSFESNLNSNLYNIIIEHIETSQNISTMVNGIIFNKMYGPLNSSKRAQNVEVKVGCDMEFTRFKLFNKHNPKIVFSIGIIDGYYDEEDDDYVSPDFGDSSPKIVVIDKDCHRFMELVP